MCPVAGRRNAAIGTNKERAWYSLRRIRLDGARRAGVGSSGGSARRVPREGHAPAQLQKKDPLSPGAAGRVGDAGVAAEPPAGGSLHFRGSVDGGFDVARHLELGEARAELVAAREARGRRSRRRAERAASDAAHLAGRGDAPERDVPGGLSEHRHSRSPPRRSAAVRHTLQRGPAKARAPAQNGQSARRAEAAGRGRRRSRSVIDLNDARTGYNQG